MRARARTLVSASVQPPFATTDTPITKLIPSSGEALPVIGIGTNRWVADTSPEETQAFRDVLTVFRNQGGRVIDTAPVLPHL